MAVKIFETENRCPIGNRIVLNLMIPSQDETIIHLTKGIDNFSKYQRKVIESTFIKGIVCHSFREISEEEYLRLKSLPNFTTECLIKIFL